MLDRLRALWSAVWHDPRPPVPDVPWWRDALLVGAAAASAVLEGLLRTDLPRPAANVLLVLVLLPALARRRRYAFVATVSVFAVFAVVPFLTDGEVPTSYSVAFFLVLPAALMRWGSGREAVVGGAVVLGTWASAVLRPPVNASDVVGGLAILALSGSVGVALRFSARARQRGLERAASVERERIARDLHDTVAHHVSAIAVRAQAGIATADSDPATAVDALRVIEAEASRTLASMRGVVRALREGDESSAGDSGSPLASLQGLASGPGATPRVAVHVSGDLTTLDGETQAAVFRVAQEGVTNARRHARGLGVVSVRVRAADAAVTVRVEDDGEGAAAPPVPGYGLIGMRERVEALGGRLAVGPTGRGGWLVVAVLPGAGTR